MYIVSFCIPVYNKKNISRQLVLDILKNSSREFQVVVSDNCSTDGTLEALKEIRDKRLKVVSTSNTVSAPQNWLNALNNADGVYLYFVIGRDRICASNIDKLIEVLKLANENDIVCLYDQYKNYTQCDKNNPIILWKSKYDKYTKVVRRIHPTGTIFRCHEFLENKERYKYYESDFTYPENFIRADMCQKYKVGEISCCHDYPDGFYLGKKTKSTFNVTMDVPFWSPQGHTRDSLRLIDKIIEDQELTDKELQEIFMWYYASTLRYGTYEWEKMLWNGEEHYSIKKRKVLLPEKLRNVMSSYIYANNKYGCCVWYSSLLKQKVLNYTIIYMIKVISRNLGYYDPPGQMRRSISYKAITGLVKKHE